MDKELLIDAINSNGYRNNIFTIYYNIGRALPFIVQRFPGGRCSDWYKSQYIEVRKIVPGGKGGIYGKAYGFYYRNGERADSSDTPGTCWCKKDDTEPQLIPNSGCGSWFIIDILGEPTHETTKIYSLNDTLDFGRHKGKTLQEVIHTDFQWVQWAVENADHFFCNIDEVIEEHKKDVKRLMPTDIIDIGKYKGKTAQEVFETDFEYLVWLSQKVEGYQFSIDDFKK